MQVKKSPGGLPKAGLTAMKKWKNSLLVTAGTEDCDLLGRV